MFEQFNGIPSRIIDLLAAGVLSSFGGIAAYLYTNSKNGNRFKVGTFFTNAALAFFVGNVVGSFFPHDMAGRDGVLLLAGFCCFPILGLVEQHFVKFLSKKVEAVTGVSLESQDGKNK